MLHKRTSRAASTRANPHVLALMVFPFDVRSSAVWCSAHIVESGPTVFTSVMRRGRSHVLIHALTLGYSGCLIRQVHRSPSEVYMKVGILAGGVGSRLSEETSLKPKPMVEVGEQPILFHLMHHYAHYGFNEFVVALGYKGEVIKKYFADYCALAGSVSVDMSAGTVAAHDGPGLDWRVDLIDTGISTNTGGRIKRLAPYMGDETFMLTWGDGLSDIDLKQLLAFHRSHGKLATVTAVRPLARFGHMEIEHGQVRRFTEKPQTAEGWINGAFFVLEPGVFDYVENDDTAWDYGPMPRLAAEGQLMAYQYEGFWQCMDTLRDKKLLDRLWASGDAPWKARTT